MSTLPFQLLMAALAGWVNRSQQDVIEYLQVENRVLRRKYCLRAGELSIRPGPAHHQVHQCNGVALSPGRVGLSPNRRLRAARRRRELRDRDQRLRRQ